ncbi:MAG: methylmalonyl Co-A mutase-associated GTPase MeaB [Thermoproteota archaeon]|nr:methylmalonyl Co-A mutase-associated GTPase MeaB [Thermoproteota archaeon]
MDIVDNLILGDKRAIARSISIIDDGDPQSTEILKKIYQRTGNAITIGFTGPGGAGKSTLIGNLIPYFKKLGYKVAILAVDPTSPITGGAILGDRVRMQSTMDDEDVFMRSFGSRGTLGGISKSLRNAIRILDAAGYTLILVESVGAGQLEVEISKVVNMTIVVFSPNTGDSVQAVKAGLTEIGDIYIVNKSEIEGSATMYYSLLEMIGETPRKPLIVKISAKMGEGLQDLCSKVDTIVKSNEWILKQKQKQKQILNDELTEMVLEKVKQKTLKVFKIKSQEIDKLLESMLNKIKDPYTASEELSLLIFSNK